MALVKDTAFTVGFLAAGRWCSQYDHGSKISIAWFAMAALGATVVADDIAQIRDQHDDAR